VLFSGTLAPLDLCLCKAFSCVRSCNMPRPRKIEDMGTVPPGDPETARCLALGMFLVQLNLPPLSFFPGLLLEEDRYGRWLKRDYSGGGANLGC
jgi:hypothetical protein